MFFLETMLSFAHTLRLITLILQAVKMVNIKEWQKRLMAQNERTALPIMTHPGIDLLGRSVLEAVTKGEIHYQAIRAVAEKYPTAAATMIMDLTVEAEAFGSTVTFAEHEVPTVTGSLVPNPQLVQQLKVPAIGSGRVNEYLKAATLAAENIKDKPVFGGCIGPFSLAGRLYGMTEIMTDAFMEPEAIDVLLEKCNRFLLSYITAMKKTGINGIIIAEPAAGLLDESMCEMLSSVYVKRLVDQLQDDRFMVILHNCGNTGHVTNSMAATGAAGLHFGNRIDMHGLLTTVPADILVLGNLDPVGLFKMASPDELRKVTLNLLRITRDFPNFILSTGCDTPPGVPLENIEAFFSALQEYNDSIH
jgi:uroporphyrinogen decarboxylase